MLIAACNQPDSAASPTPTPGNETVAAAPSADATTRTPEAGGNPLTPDQQNVVKLAAVMAAMTEVCGMTKPDEAQAARAELKAKMAAEGGSPAEVDQIYTASLDEAKTKAAADPAKVQRDCGVLKKMADPAELKKLQEMAAQAEAQLKQ
ncbi:hypothetical protein [Solilutibacter pythonis]|uniref:hypothetical protein n=1 Tax=Solilutibacter pythonis TaxID=2483112 RepID=UPI0011C3FD55|nr:hypothetical protein [Lysobacter pythonis]